MLKDTPLLDILNKIAYENKLPLKVIEKIYDEQIHLMELMLSQHNVYERNTYINMRFFNIINIMCNMKNIYYGKNRYRYVKEWYDKRVRNETRRIDKLFLCNKRYVEFINAIRKKCSP